MASLASCSSPSGRGGGKGINTIGQVRDRETRNEKRLDCTQQEQILIRIPDRQGPIALEHILPNPPSKVPEKQTFDDAPTERGGKSTSAKATAPQNADMANR